MRPRSKGKSNILWDLFTRTRQYHEYHQSTRRRNWEPRAIKHGSVRITVNFTSFECTQRKFRHNSKTNRREDRQLKWIQSKRYRRKRFRRILTRRNTTYSVPKRPRKLFHKEKEESSDHLEYDDFIPNCSINSSSENIFTRSKIATEGISDLQREMVDLQRQMPTT